MKVAKYVHKGEEDFLYEVFADNFVLLFAQIVILMFINFNWFFGYFRKCLKIWDLCAFCKTKRDMDFCFRKVIVVLSDLGSRQYFIIYF